MTCSGGCVLKIGCQQNQKASAALDVTAVLRILAAGLTYLLAPKNFLVGTSMTIYFFWGGYR